MNDRFHKGIKEMLKDEAKAPKDYYKLRSMAHTKGEKKVINSIIKDERSHYSKLNSMSKNCHKRH